MIKINEQKGFTLVELMMAVVVFSIIVLAVGETYVLFQRYWLNARRDVAYQSSGRTVIDIMGREIRNSEGVSVTNTVGESVMQINTIDGNVIEYVYDAAEDKITKEDAGSAEDILYNVVPIDSGSIFQIQGARLVTINFRVRDPIVEDGYQGSDFSLQVYWRN